MRPRGHCPETVLFEAIHSHFWATVFGNDSKPRGNEVFGQGGASNLRLDALIRSSTSAVFVRVADHTST